MSHLLLVCLRRHTFSFSFLCSLLLSSTLLFTACDNPYSPTDNDDTPTTGGGGGNTGGDTNQGISIGFNITGVESASYDNEADAPAKALAPMRATAQQGTPLKDVCSHVVLAVYDDSKNKVGEVSQSTSDDNFGQASLQLEKGTYTVVVIGHNGTTKPVMTKPDKITFGGKLTDTFYCCQEIEVNDKCNFSLVLKRAVAMFRLQTNDATPTEIKTMQFYYTGGSSTFNALTGKGCVNSKQTEKRTVSTQAYKGTASYDVFTFPRSDSKELTITVSALDKNDNAIFVREFKKVPIACNNISYYEGKFYGESADGARASFNTLVDAEWTVNHYTYNDGSANIGQ